MHSQVPECNLCSPVHVYSTVITSGDLNANILISSLAHYTNSPRLRLLGLNGHGRRTRFSSLFLYLKSVRPERQDKEKVDLIVKAHSQNEIEWARYSPCTGESVSVIQEQETTYKNGMEILASFSSICRSILAQLSFLYLLPGGESIQLTDKNLVWVIVLNVEESCRVTIY